MKLEEYQEFVKQVTSQESNEMNCFLKRMEDLRDPSLSLLITSAIGLSSETGEFNEIVKKILFQGKPFNDETRFHMKRELGDIIWYWMNACRSLNYDPNEVIQENVNKLMSRYPNMKFEDYFSEHRKPNDL
jgi:NTP pyrophosphatase (non-canonical NTP hydrolase)